MILDLIREEMVKNKIDFYIINTSDPHSSEYIPEYYKEREFVTGFTGSAGISVITLDEAYLWTDGRYYIQAENEIKNTGFKLMKMGLEGVPSYMDWILQNIKNGDIIGINLEYFTQYSYEKLTKLLKDKNISNVKIKDIDLVSNIWEDRPQLSKEEIFIYSEKYSGMSTGDKLKLVRKKMKEIKADLTIISSLDDIAWLFNIRGSDIEFSPAVISYGIVEENKSILFIDKTKINNMDLDILENNLEIYDYEEIYPYIENYINKKIYINKSKTNCRLFNCIGTKNKIIDGEEITSTYKSIKNEIELSNIREAFIKDGIALTKFIYWVKNTVKTSKLTEYEAALKLKEFKKNVPGYLYDSFETISAYGKNAAMMHYHATENNSALLNNKGFLLVDTGSQYYEGTTDITRTIALGELSKDERRDFTIVLKSHLMLSTCIFTKNTTGRSLDSIARYNVWKNRTDYKSGTGHGIGCFLNVHEAPPSISPRAKDETLEVGMIVSNEPGIYKEDKHGIRIENILEVVYDGKFEDDIFYRFNTISFAPIDLDAVDVNLLDCYEIEALNYYHSKVYSNISPFLNGEEKEWLYNVTRELKK